MPFSTTWWTSLTVPDPGTSLPTAVTEPSRILFEKAVLRRRVPLVLLVLLLVLILL